MAYGDYGAFVWLNGKRRKDKEDVATFATDEETFGTSSANIPSGARIWVSLINQKNKGEKVDFVNHIHHGILGDGDIRVMCHKMGLPSVYEVTENGFELIKYKYWEDIEDRWNYESINFEYKDHKFVFEAGHPYYTKMVTPDGDVWECKYDYEYGAGF